MTGGEIAALIAAVAFAALVVFLIIVLLKVSKVIGEVQTTVNEANKSISILTKDADSLLIEVEGLLNKSNATLDDVNGKLGKTDPVFKAIGDLGATVSSLNDSTRNLTTHVTGATKKTAQAGMVSKMGKTAVNMNKKRKNKKEHV
ncbi:Uncharacterized protein YoxC, contains an MCP-like domain [Carnobacterium alterfunditum]|uniref:Uncharacterized protein YoxC, contains an MCP-like domain n=1 Tax=Carnobacterium alterfunditum TaxID=28230 RepID=A0A1N6G558_9LACT|nr:DUF948 domain-containing protein [Carnobacterium alterfunditum]SIO02679.1 Uncharacterized protein YoxC, contains an MCP-like domain [Carnobacterium alterfunditum]